MSNNKLSKYNDIKGINPASNYDTDQEEKKNYSATCNLDDEDRNNDCWHCSEFCFPIGCMVERK